ncbi:MAG: type II secretion system protein [Candidatus Moraniibacteriota bacterium]
MQTKTKLGFTLIEMIVVVAIIGILSTLLLVSISGIRKNAVCTRRESNLENVRGAVNMYYSVKTTWPSIAGGWSGLIQILTEQNYLTENVSDDDDGDGIPDYSVTPCALGEGCQMKLCNTCIVTGREGYDGNTRCLNVK